METKNEHCSAMQVLKEQTRQDILKSAKKEFLLHGFEKSSMRSIARSAKVSTSNIYNYFPSKDDIFQAVLQPVLNELDKGEQILSKPNHLERRLQFSYETLKRRFNVVLSFVDENRDEFQLLLFQSNGSRLESYKDELLGRITKSHLQQIENLKNIHPQLNAKAHHLFVRNLISFFVNIFVEMVRNDIAKNELLESEESFLKFLHYGIKGIVN